MNFKALKKSFEAGYNWRGLRWVTAESGQTHKEEKKKKILASKTQNLIVGAF